ncbi:MAG: hypothetical protein WC326_13585 [Candidatus Delongbacteria bacterium]
MLRCPACHTTTQPLRHLLVTARRPYRCSGCGAEYIHAGLDLSRFALFFVVWLLVYQVLQLLAWPLPLRLAAVAGAAVLVIWLLLPLRPLHAESEPEAGPEEEV